MATGDPRPVEQDSRGILDPWLLRQRVVLTRYPVAAGLVGLVDRFWVVEWDLPAGAEHSQQVLTHPGANLSVGHAETRPRDAAPGSLEARLNGVARTLTTRVLTGHGWAVAAMTTPGGLGAFVRSPARDFTDRVVGLGAPTGLDEPALIRRLADGPDREARVAALGAALEGVVAAADPQRVSRSREAAEVATLLESDRSLLSIADLCHRTGFGARTLQRLFTTLLPLERHRSLVMHLNLSNNYGRKTMQPCSTLRHDQQISCKLLSRLAHLRRYTLQSLQPLACVYR